MKYILINSENKITALLNNKVSEDCIEVSDDIVIHIGYDSYINGEIVSSAEYAATQQRSDTFTRILELKKLLADSDYICLKHADGELTDEEYAEVKAQRHAWRVRINELEALMEE